MRRCGFGPRALTLVCLAVRDAPQVFTQTVEDGISPFHGDFTFETFKAFHAFRTLEIKEHKMVPFTTHAAANALAEEQPVFLKLFEEWCPHCKKMKKHFQALSNEVDDITMMEVECSKTEASKEFCAKVRVSVLRPCATGGLWEASP
jgi:thiol-disulfide isomerase/thioredoxin